ncbi:hypothetical protein DB346_11615 [Verrucomicrobia bacterium LW23]|nr:hypothetical protein DB346_11615 [Verrucomicrobia bacterium LW23]
MSLSTIHSLALWLRQSIVAWLVVSMMLGLQSGMVSLRANPSGGSVQGGSVSVSNTGPGQVTVRQTTERAVVNWNSFSIEQGETTTFVQPGAKSAVLNRVTGGSASRLDGSLNANGQVYLVNRNGIVVGKTGRVNTAGFTASTHDVSNAEFMAGGDLNFSGSSSAKVQNFGKIRATDGDVTLIARDVENSGRITAKKGTVNLAGGTEVLVKPSGTDGQRVFIRSSSGSGTVVNSGNIRAMAAELRAAGGNEYALAVNNSGVIRATGIDKSGGRIVLKAEGPAGRAGTVRNSGSLVARASRSSAPGTRGGGVEVTGDRVNLTATSRIDASSPTGKGGTVYIGGGFQGKDSAIANARVTTVEAGSEINVDGAPGSDFAGPPSPSSGKGNGGTAIIWSDERTDFFGSITARDGGFAEISSKGLLAFAGRVDTGGGMLLLDPASITISQGLSTQPGSLTISTVDSVLNVQDLVTLLASGDVTLQAANYITVATAVNSLSGNNLQFDTSILYLNASINLNGGTLSGTPSLTQVYVQPAALIQNGLDAVAAGGNVYLTAGTYTQSGINISKAVTITGAGSDATIIDGGGTAVSGILDIDVAPADQVNLIGLGITRGNSTQNGGGILVRGGSFSMVDSRIYGNQTSASGGGIALRNSVSATLSNVVIESNQAAAGGGIYAEVPQLSISNSRIANNTATNDYGGGVRLASGVSTANFNNTTIFGNSAVVEGGGIYSQAADLTLVNSTVSTNTAQRGGGIFVADSAGSYNLGLRSSIVELNVATNRGSGIYAGQNSVTLIDNTQVRNNGDTISSGEGGGVYVNAGTVTIQNNSAFTSNIGTVGGGIYADAANVSITSSTFNTNSARFGRGGGIYSRLSTLTLAGVTMHGNTSASAGGGIEANSGGALIISGSTFRNNQSIGTGGGGVFSNTGVTLDLSTSLFDNNSAPFGGGLAVAQGTVRTSTFINNTSSSSGGGIYIGSGVVLDTVTVAHNRAGTSGGGVFAQFLSGTPARIWNSTIARNHANGEGGGIFVSSPTVVNLSNSIVAANTAGNAIYNDLRLQPSAANFTSGGYNIVGIGDYGSMSSDGTTGVGYVDNATLGLAPLGWYGGPTPTIALMAGSVAHNNGPSLASTTFDQRGRLRLYGTAQDVGAFEAQATGSYTVTNTQDYNPGLPATAIGGSLRFGISGNLAEVIDSITFNIPTSDTGYNGGTGKWTISNTYGQYVINRSLTIDASTQPGYVPLGGNPLIVLDGENARRLIYNIAVASSPVTLNALELTRGTATDGGAILSGPSTLNVQESRITFSRSTNAGGGGGGIYVSGGTLNLSNSTLFRNQAALAGGGLVVDGGGTANVTRSAFLDNTAGFGGGIRIGVGGGNINSSTFSGNEALIDGGSAIDTDQSISIIGSTFSGNINTGGRGTIYSFGPPTNVTIRNSIVANSINGPDLAAGSSGSFTDGGYNIIEDVGALGTTFVAPGTVTGVDPGLSALGWYGGATQTFGLLPGSIALNAIPTSNYAPGDTDQRGVTRGADSPGNRADIGAFESREVYTVTNTRDYNPATVTHVDGTFRLGLAINSAGIAEGSVINFNIPTSDPGRNFLSGTYTIRAATGSGGFDITSGVTINGHTQPGYVAASGPIVFIDGMRQGTTLAINAAPGAAIQINALGISGGQAQDTGGVFSGGGVLLLGGNLTLNAAWVKDNTAADNGGGIYAASGTTLTLVDTRVERNQADGSGGGIDSRSTVNISGSVIYNNRALGVGGGIRGGGGTVTIAGTVIQNNSSATSGGGIWFSGGTLSINTASLLRGNSLSATGAGAAVNLEGGTFQLTDSSVIGNGGPNGNGSIASGAGNGIITISLSLVAFNQSSTTSGSAGIVIATGGLTVNNGSIIIANNGYVGSGAQVLTSATIQDSYLIGNISRSGGGAITWASGSGPLTIGSSYLIGNSTTDKGGAFQITGGSFGGSINTSLLAGNYAQGDGGAIHVAGAFSITDSTLRYNTAQAGNGGAVYKDGSILNINGSTLDHNRAGLQGGGLYNNAAVTTIAISTIANNTATNGGGIYHRGGSLLQLTSVTISQNSGGLGAGILLEGVSSVNLRSSIVAGNLGPSDILGSVTDLGYNVVGLGGTGYIGTTRTGVVNPRLAALANNGGTTQTMALLPGSAALGTGDISLLGTPDQRGYNRADGIYDAGAYQSRGFTYTITAGDGQSATVGTAFGPMTVTVTSNDVLLTDLTGGAIILTPPTSGATLTGMLTQPLTLESGTWQSTLTPTAAGSTGTYQVTIAQAGPTPFFTLTNLAGPLPPVPPTVIVLPSPPTPNAPLPVVLPPPTLPDAITLPTLNLTAFNATRGRNNQDEEYYLNHYPSGAFTISYDTNGQPPQGILHLNSGDILPASSTIPSTRQP